jgi:spore maturation protein CgeB
LPPLYGQSLYESIGKSKFVVNAYTDFNQYFKSNMRVFESLSCGSLLISEEGNYPDGFEANKNFMQFKNSKDLISKIPKFIENYSSLKENMVPFINKVKNIYSKENQWDRFNKIINENSQLIQS